MCATRWNDKQLLSALALIAYRSQDIVAQSIKLTLIATVATYLKLRSVNVIVIIVSVRASIHVW